MSDLKFIQFNAPVTTAPVPPVRDKNENIVGGDRLQSFTSEVDDLSRLLFSSTRFVTISEAARSMPQAYAAALDICLKRHEFTKAFSPAELKRMAEAEAQAKRNAENAKRYAAERAALEEAERIDRLTREQAANFTPRSASTQKGSPAYVIERARYIAALNETRAEHKLLPLTV